MWQKFLPQLIMLLLRMWESSQNKSEKKAGRKYAKLPDAGNLADYEKAKKVVGDVRKLRDRLEAFKKRRV